MTSYESTYPVYYRGTAKIGDNLSVAELERIARSGNKKNPRAATTKRYPLKTNMRKAALQTTARRRVNIIASFAFAGLGIAGLLSIPKVFVQSEPNKVDEVATASYVSVPQKFVAKPSRTQGEGSPVRNEVLEARHIVNTPMTNSERHAKPFVDRMLGNPEMMGLINSVSVTTNTPVPSLMEAIAAETGGKPENPLQVTPHQFPQLLGTYGHTYAVKMEAYAETLPSDKAQLICAQAAELNFVTQFMKYKKDHYHFEMRNDLYKDYVQKTLGKKAKSPSLQQRIEALYQTEYIRTGMQALSNNADREKIQGLLGDRDPQQVFGTDAIFRLVNYFGIQRTMHFSEISHREGLPVIGNLMTKATAKANHVDYHIKEEKVTIKTHGHFKHVIKEIKIPITIGELKKTQLEPWNGTQEGIRGQLARDRAQRILMSQGLKPKN